MKRISTTTADTRVAVSRFSTLSTGSASLARRSSKCIHAHVLSLALLVAIGIGTGPFATTASAITIDFDGLSVGSSVTNQFSEVTFSAGTGANTVLSAPGSSPAHTPPNFICSTLCAASTFLDFTAPVFDLTFWAINANDIGVTAQFNVFENGLFSATVDFVSSGGGNGHNEFIDLSAFGNVTRLEIVNITEPSGIGWDTFSFTAVPEPSTAMLLSLGLVGMAAKRGGRA